MKNEAELNALKQRVEATGARGSDHIRKAKADYEQELNAQAVEWQERYMAEIEAQVDDQVNLRLAQAMQGLNLDATENAHSEAVNVNMLEESKDDATTEKKPRVKRSV